MTLRTITFDDSTHKLMPLEPTDEMAMAAIKVSLRNPAINGVPQWVAMIAAAPECQPIDLSNFDPEENWQNIDGAVAYHLIDRHADNWSDVGRMMDAWLKANQDTKKDE